LPPLWSYLKKKERKLPPRHHLFCKSVLLLLLLRAPPLSPLNTFGETHWKSIVPFVVITHFFTLISLPKSKQNKTEKKLDSIFRFLPLALSLSLFPLFKLIETLLPIPKSSRPRPGWACLAGPRRGKRRAPPRPSRSAGAGGLFGQRLLRKGLLLPGFLRFLLPIVLLLLLLPRGARTRSRPP